MGDIISYVYEFGGFTLYLMELFQELKIMNPLSHYAM